MSPSDARVVDQDVNVAPAAHGCFDQGVYLLRVGHVRLNGDRLDAHALDFGDDFISGGAGAGVVDHDVGAFCCESDRRGSANPP